MDRVARLPLEPPGVPRKKVTVTFDGGRLSSAGGVPLPSQVERGLGIAERLAACPIDGRDAARVDHTIYKMLELKMFAIAAGYEDADDCDALREDSVFKMAPGRAPGRRIASLNFSIRPRFGALKLFGWARLSGPESLCRPVQWEFTLLPSQRMIP